jgi:hypothetical protein
MDDALLMRGLGMGPRAMCAERSSPSTSSMTSAREAEPDPVAAGISSMP